MSWAHFEYGCWKQWYNKYIIAETKGGTVWLTIFRGVAILFFASMNKNLTRETLQYLKCYALE